jgi:hypothetical protein
MSRKLLRFFADRHAVRKVQYFLVANEPFTFAYVEEETPHLQSIAKANVAMPTKRARYGKTSGHSGAILIVEDERKPWLPNALQARHPGLSRSRLSGLALVAPYSIRDSTSVVSPSTVRLKAAIFF